MAYAGIEAGEPVQLPVGQAFELNSEQFPPNWLEQADLTERTDRLIFEIIEPGDTPIGQYVDTSVLVYDSGAETVTRAVTYADIILDDLFAMTKPAIYAWFTNRLAATLTRADDTELVLTPEFLTTLYAKAAMLTRVSLGHFVVTDNMTGATTWAPGDGVPMFDTSDKLGYVWSATYYDDLQDLADACFGYEMTIRAAANNFYTSLVTAYAEAGSDPAAARTDMLFILSKLADPTWYPSTTLTV